MATNIVIPRSPYGRFFSHRVFHLKSDNSYQRLVPNTVCDSILLTGVHCSMSLRTALKAN